ncbi:MAG: gamma-glutamyl-phosphate reductase, partial [Armatimonadota bacterium]
MGIKEDVLQQAERAAKAAEVLRVTTDEKRNEALLAMVKKIRNSVDEIKEANRQDMEAGEKAGLSAAMLDRLELTDSRIEGMAVGLEQVAGFEDPLGRVLEERTRPNGLHLQKVSVPLGVIGVVYESRP